MQNMHPKPKCLPIQSRAQTRSKPCRDFQTSFKLVQNTIWKRNKNRSGVSLIIDLKLQISMSIVNTPRYCNLVLDLQKKR